jgi:MFS family permease
LTTETTADTPASDTGAGPPSATSADALAGKDRRFALLLGVPSFALALALAVLSTYLPVLARRFTSSTAVIGTLVGGEGLIAVLLPVWIGRLSDHTQTRLGPRLPFMLVAAPLAAAAIGLMPFAPSLWVMSIEVFVFYLAYFSYFSPYRALYPDLVSEAASARAQGIQGVFNGAGLGVALVGGGFLLAAWRPLPYLLAGTCLLAATGIVYIGLGRGATRQTIPERDATSPFRELWTLLHDDHAILRFVIGNALLTLGLGGLKSFVVLWLTEGLGKSMTFTAGAMTVVAAGTVIGALISGKLGDRYGPGRVLAISLCVFGAGLSVGTFSTSVPVLAVAFPFIALAGGAAVALPYALLMELTPSKKHGIVAGLFDASSGVGTLLGPTITGGAIELLRPWFPASHGYSAMWPVLSISVMGSTAILWRAGKAKGAAGAASPTTPR